MNRTDIDRVQAYLRRLFGSNRINLIAPARSGMSVEVAVDEEVIGTIHKDTEDGETSYAVHITVLEEDLPPAPPAPAASPPRGRR
jgi:hypothetical protein